MNTALDSLIAEKQAVLQLARKKVAELETQIATLKTMAAPDEFDEFLQRRANVDGAAPVAQEQAPRQIIHPRDNVLVGRDDKSRNPKGSVKALLLSILTGEDKPLDDVLKELNSKTKRPITRSALRTALMTMRNEELAESSRPGMFRLRSKGESHATVNGMPDIFQ